MNSLSSLKESMRDEIRQEMASTLEATQREIAELRQAQAQIQTPESRTHGPAIVDTIYVM